MASITVHCVVKNEEKWVWYALNSVIDIAQKVLIFDTGSTDKTVEIIKKIKNKKIVFEQKGEVDAKGLVNLRKNQLERTKTSWFLILDGDEIWPQKTKKELIQKLKNAKDKDWGVVVRAYNFVGDIYHVHPESINYHWPFAPKNYIGWANLRVLKTSAPGLGIAGEYPLEYYYDKTGSPIQNYGSKHLMFLKNRYLHTTYLMRSENRTKDRESLNRAKKAKLELGIKLPKNFAYPKILFDKRQPKTFFPIWKKRSLAETSLAAVQTPFKETRRKLLKLYFPKG